ncbi:MAG: hypothetical protein R3E65_10565 [Steroidobacteraceae bacterium]
MKSPPVTRRGRPATGKAMSAAERMRRLRARRKAAGLRAVATWQPAENNVGVWSSHRIKDARSLALHIAAVQRIERDPRLLDRARETLQRWAVLKGKPAPAWLSEWQRLLAQDWPVVAERVTALDEDAARLRQSSPLTVLLPAADRKRIYEAFRA